MNDGLWHSVEVRREEDFVEMMVDWGEGFYSNNSLENHHGEMKKRKKREVKRSENGGIIKSYNKNSKNGSNKSRNSKNINHELDLGMKLSGEERAGFVVAKKGGVFVGADVKLITPDGSAYIQDDFNNGVLDKFQIYMYVRTKSREYNRINRY